MNDEKDAMNGYFTDDGTPVNADFLSKPSLCVMCRKDDEQSESILCNLNRIDQQNNAEFVCGSYEPK